MSSCATPQGGGGGGGANLNPSPLSSSSLLYNSSPKPFSRQEINHDWQRASSSARCQCSLKQQQPMQVPKIMLNDQQQQQQQSSSSSSYPTSTVHKSLLGSGLKQQTASERSSQRSQHDDVHYSRLMSSPAQSSTPSECPVAARQATQPQASSSERAAEFERKSVNFSEMEVAKSSPSSRINVGGHEERNVAAHRYDAISLPQRQDSVPQFWNRIRPTEHRHQHDSNVVKPDSKRAEFMFTRQLERASIAHQTYRTLPIVCPKPKARHDLASGTYMSLTQDPTWELTHSGSRPSSEASSSYKNRGDHHERKIQQAMMSEGVSFGLFFFFFSFLIQKTDLYFAPQNQMLSNSSSSSNMCPIHSQHMDSSEAPIFNYRQYIESTRRGH